MIRLTILLIVSILSSSAATYYVDSSAGRDTNPGTLASPWGSIYKVSTFQGFNPGDQVLFKAGSYWEAQQLAANTPGLTYGSYGTGPKPVISGFRTFTGLSYNSASQTWSVPIGWNPLQVFIDGVRAQQVASVDEIVHPGQWFAGNNLLTVRSGSGAVAPSVLVSCVLSVVAVNAPDITLQDLEVAGAAWYSVEGSATAAYDRLTIRRCLFRDSFGDSIRLGGLSSHNGVIIQNNEIRNAGANGILLTDNSVNSVISNNRVWGNCKLKSDMPGGFYAQTWSAGIKVFTEVPGYLAGTKVQGNEVYGNAPEAWVKSDTLDQARGVGIWVDTVSIPSGDLPVLILSNRAYGNHSCGIYLENTANVGAEWNYIFDNAEVMATANFCLQDDSGGTSSNSWGYKNVISGTGWAQVRFANAGGTFVHNRFVGNVVTQSGNGWTLDVIGNAVDPKTDDNLVDHNVYTGVSQIKINGIYSDVGTNFTSLGAWAAATGEDVHSAFVPGN